MKLKKLKLVLLTILLFAGTVDAQMYMKHPTDVRYIGGNMINRRPFFKSLDAALNDVKALATSERPYIFWVVSDTINVVDWDSVYQSGGLAMNDSIDVHYVAVGKIKWGGFAATGTGGGGGGIHAPPINTTTHYSLYTWTGQSGLQVWQANLGANADSIDERIWELIVYTDSTYLYIENDTLKIRESTISDLITAAGARPDTTIISYKAGNETITGTRLFDDNVTIGAGSLRLASANNNTGVSRVLWSTSNKPYFSGAGATSNYIEILGINVDTGVLQNDSLITWNNLNANVKEQIHLGVDLIYHETHIYKDVPSTVALLTGGGWLTVPTQIAGQTQGMTSATDSSVTIATTGLYQVNFQISYTGANTQIVEGGVFLDNVLQEGSGFWRKMGTGADVGSSGGTDIIAITAGEVLEIKLRSPGTTNDVTVHIFNLNLNRLD